MTSIEPFSEPHDEEIKAMRAAILLTKSAATTMNFSEELARKIEADYVVVHKEHPKYGQEYFKLTLSLAKYISVLDGSGTPDGESYLKAKSIVIGIMERNDKFYPPTTQASAQNIHLNGHDH